MGQEDVLVEVIINGKDMLQFYSTKENYKTLYEDRDALVDTVKTAFKEGILYSADISNVEDINSVQFLSEVAEMTVDAAEVQQVVQEGEPYHQSFEIIEEQIDNITSSAIPEELIIDVGISPGADERLNLCPHCDYRTFNVGHFKIHMRQHTGESPFECNICDYRSKQKSNLKRHMRQHLLGKDHFECKLCNFTCTQEKVHKRHMILHSRTRPLRPCPFCDYFSTSLAHLTVHIRQHTGETPYHCGLCSYKTVQKSNLTRHLKKHRRGRTSKADKLRCCPHCSYRTPNPAHLMAHIRAAHTGETPYACNLCSYKSAQRSNLKRHLRKHSGERPFHCHLCSYSTAYPYVLKKHIENHPPVDNTKMSCDLCDYTSYSSFDFKKHVKTHAGKPIHTCNICGYISINSDHLKVHMRRHSLERPFQCKYCSYSSAQKSNLLRHYQYKHSGARQNHPEATGSSDENITTEEIHEETIHNENDEDMDMENAEIQESREVDYEEGTQYMEGISDHVHEVEVEKSHEEQENERLEVITEEDVITTPLEEIIDDTRIGRYGEGSSLEKKYHCVHCSFRSPELLELKVHMSQHRSVYVFKCKFCGFETKMRPIASHHMRNHLGDIKHLRATENRKQSLSFLNKKQAEKLKEFKRLLQEGTHQPSSSQPPNLDENIKNNATGDFDNVSENTESCTEEPLLDEDLQDSPPNEGEHSSNHGRGVRSHIVYEQEALNINQLEEDSSVIIVQESIPGSEEYEIYSCDVDNPEEVPKEEGLKVVIACELCGYETYTVSELKAHIATHTAVTAPSVETITPSYFTCDKCSFRAFRKLDIGRHKALFHGATPPQRLPFVCGKCGFRSGSKSEFLEHQESHTLNKNSTIKCKICDLKLTNYEELRNHSRKHIGEEPFECYLCAYLTAKKSHLRSHSKLKHSLARNGGTEANHFQCYTCGYDTYKREDFQNHIGKHRSEDNKTYKCHFDHCRFLTLDEDIFNKHLLLHDGGGREELDVADASRGSLATPNSSTEMKKFRRIPLKEYGNLPESDKSKLLLSTLRSSTSPALHVGHKKLLKEDVSSSPLKRKRKGLRSLKPDESIIENRLSRKFNFNTKNLVTNPKRVEPGYKIDFTGEVFKGHGSLKKFSNYGDIIKKSDNELVVVMSHPENDGQLKVIYNQLKEILSSMDSLPEGISSQLTIFFREMYEEDSSKQDEPITDAEMEISSDDDYDTRIPLPELGSDVDLYDVSDIESLDDSSPKSPEKDSFKIEGNGFRKRAPEIVFDFNGPDNVQLIQEKIRERNEKRQELRRQKIINLSKEVGNGSCA